MQAGVTIENQYKFSFANSDTGLAFGMYYSLEVLQNQTYTVSNDNIPTGCSLRLEYFPNLESVGDSGQLIGSQIFEISNPYTFTIPTGCGAIRVYYVNRIDDNPVFATGTFTFSNPMLNLGAEPLPFEPQKPSYLYLPDCNLRSNIDGSVADRLYTDGQGKPRVTRRFREVALDGSLVWGFQSGASGTGYKTVQTLNFPVGYERNVEPNVIKFDGSKLKYGAPTTDGADYLSATNWSNLGNTVLSIPNTDSGWGESYTPTIDEIKAYFYGWRMYRDGIADDETPYSTGTKAWRHITPAGTAKTGHTTTLPTSVNPLSTWTPYRLMYQLAQSLDENTTYEGSLMLHEGDNQVEVGTGIVAREVAKPYRKPDGTVYWIEGTSDPAYLLKYRPKRARSVYRNGIKDNWREFVNATTHPILGDVYLEIATSQYDPAAAYSVTYLALDTYTIGIAPQTISAEYAPNIRESVESLVRELVEARTETSVLQNTKAQKQQPQWIEAALLSDWTGLLRYSRNDEGYVTLTFALTVGVTALNTIVCRLPFEYRSANNTAFTTSNNNTGTTGLGLGVNSTLGGIIVTGSTNFSTGHIIYGTVTYKGR